MAVSQTILREVMLGLRETDGEVRFAQPPNFLRQRIRDLEPDAQRATIKELSALGFVLQRDGSPQASSELMRLLMEIVESLKPGAQP